MQMLSPSLKHEVRQHLFYNVIQQIPVFQDSPEIFEFLLENIEAMQFMPDEYIIKQG
jgi:hypothetical protein